MYVVNKELMAKLPPEAQKVIAKEGQLTEELPEGEVANPDIQAPDEITKTPTPDESKEMKVNDESLLPKSLKYGDEAEFEDMVAKDGSIAELSDKKKNGIEDFDQAAERGNALLKAMDEAEGKKKKKLPVKGKPDPRDDGSGEDYGR